MIYVLGLDVGFATFGWALVELLAEGERVEAMGVIVTKKSNAKQNVLASSDDHRRAQEIAHVLYGLTGRGVRALCAESPSHGKWKGAATAIKIGRAWGVVDALTYDGHLPLVQASPQQIKKAVCGNVKASKAEVQDALCARLMCEVVSDGKQNHAQRRVGSDAIDRFVVETPRTLHEHAFDALGAVVACLDSEVIRAIRPRADRRLETQMQQRMDSILLGETPPKTPGMLTRGGVS